MSNKSKSNFMTVLERSQLSLGGAFFSVALGNVVLNSLGNSKSDIIDTGLAFLGFLIAFLILTRTTKTS